MDIGGKKDRIALHTIDTSVNYYKNIIELPIITEYEK